MNIHKILATELRQIADKLDAGTCDISQEDALEIISNICNVSMSKEQAAQYLNMPTSTFDKKVAEGKIAKSHKHKGLTERLWYLADLIKAKFSLP